MKSRGQSWSWKQVFAFLGRGYSLIRLFVLAFGSAAATFALFVMDEYKPVWLLVIACVITIVFTWMFIRNLLSTNTQSTDAESDNQTSIVEQPQPDPKPEPSYTVFQSFDEKQRWPEVLIALGLLLLCISLIIPQDSVYYDAFAVVFILSPLVLEVGLVSYVIINRESLTTWKKTLLGTATFLVGAAFLLLLLLWVWSGGWNDLAHYKYDDNWIIGRNIEEVEARYGPADGGDTIYKYVLYKDKYGLDPTGNEIYYAIFVDEHGIVESVDHYWCPGG